MIEQLGGKQLVMNHMHHEDQLVRYNALLAVQKLMVHNWYEHTDSHSGHTHTRRSMPDLRLLDTKRLVNLAHVV